MASTVDTTGRGHPIRSAAAQIHDILKTVRDAPAWSMSPADAREAMVELTRLEAQITELQLRVAHHGQTVEVEADSGATVDGELVGARHEADPAAAHRKTRLATALGSGAFEPARVALAEGMLLVDQAQVIVAAVEALPADLDATGPGGCAGDAGRVRRPPRRPGAADPGEPDPGGHRAGGRRGPRSQGSRTRGAGGGGGRVVPDGRGRAREVSRPVHDLLPARGDAEEAAAGDRGTETPHPGGRAGTRTRTPVAHTGWGRRSRSTSRPTPPTDSRIPAASRPRSW